MLSQDLSKYHFSFQIIEAVQRLNEDPNVHGIIVQVCCGCIISQYQISL